MDNEVITLKTGKINEYLHHIDMRGYGTTRMLSIFLGEFDDCSVLFDCGSSLDIKKGLRYFKKQNISLSSFKYLITSHHHFDHNGGMWKLYAKLKKYNPDVKILTNQITKELLIDFELHLNRGKRTYGNLIGEMRPIPETAFKIIDPSANFNQDPKKIDIIDIFTTNESEVKLAILKTPGHTPDHQMPLFIKDGKIDFIFFGEGVGTLYHTSKLVTMPSSMPIYYNHNKYMETLGNLKKLFPLKAGFGHFGIVNGKNNVHEIISEHENFMKTFKDAIIKLYEENPRTKFLVDKITPILTSRTDLTVKTNSIFSNVTLGIVYGMMTSLGYREIPPDELIYVKKYYS
ncbi:MAG: MBL fold metallo-hydrolase [Candidatus Hodarchaeota archaeon]